MHTARVAPERTDKPARLAAVLCVAGEMIDESVAQALTVERKGDYELGIAAWCLEAMGHSVIRQLISEFVRRRPGFPAIERIVASWSDEETEPDSAA